MFPSRFGFNVDYDHLPSLKQEDLNKVMDSHFYGHLVYPEGEAPVACANARVYKACSPQYGPKHDDFYMTSTLNFIVKLGSTPKYLRDCLKDEESRYGLRLISSLDGWTYEFKDLRRNQFIGDHPEFYNCLDLFAHEKLPGGFRVCVYRGERHIKARKYGIYIRTGPIKPNSLSHMRLWLERLFGAGSYRFILNDKIMADTMIVSYAKPDPSRLASEICTVNNCGLRVFVSVLDIDNGTIETTGRPAVTTPQKFFDPSYDPFEQVWDPLSDAKKELLNRSMEVL